MQFSSIPTRIVLIGALCACTGITGFSASALAQSADVQKIGFLMPLTGGSGKLGQMMMEGSSVAVEEINGAGGAGGKRIALDPEDSQALAQQGIDGFRKLTDIDKVNFIITGWTSVVMAVAPLAERTKTYLLSASTASPAVRGVSPYFQSTWMFDDETVKLILPYAKSKLKVKRLAVMTVMTDLGTTLRDAVKQDWERLGGTLVSDESHQQEETNFRPTMIKMLAANPDAIYLTTSNGKQTAQIVRQARELGYKGIFLSYGAMEDPELLAIGDKAEGCYYSSPAYDPAGTNPATRHFVDLFKKKYGRVPNVHQANHYDLIQMYKVAADALAKQNKPITGAALREYFVGNMPTYHGASGDYRFNYKDGSVLRSSIVKTIKNGKFIRLDNLD